MLVISACQIQPLGIPDSSFSASSSSAGNEASKAQLNGNGAWSPRTDCDANDYLQIDLQHEFFICAVATQGKPNTLHWTTKYKVLLSLNNTDWITYQENGADKVCMVGPRYLELGNNSNSIQFSLVLALVFRFATSGPMGVVSPRGLKAADIFIRNSMVNHSYLCLLLQTFNGNNGDRNIVKHNLVGITRARFIRFQPTEFSIRKALRVEVYGVLKPAGNSLAPAEIVTR